MTLHYDIHVSGKSNDAAIALSRMGLETAEAPDESRTFFSTRTIAKNKTNRLSKVRPLRNVPMDLLIIAEEALSSEM